MGTLYKLPQYRTATLEVPGGLNSSATTGIIIDAIPADIDVNEPGVLCLTWTNPIDTDNAEYITYTSINNSTRELQGVTRGQEGYSAKSHDNGSAVAWVVSKSHINNIVDKLTSDDANLVIDPNGNEIIKTTYVSSAVNELVFSNAATGNRPIISTDGEADIGIEFHNDQGEELLILEATASAVNEITIANQATGVNPQIKGTGETNVGIDLVPKGTGTVRIKGTADSAAELRLLEDSDNGSNYIGLKAPATLASNTTFVLPSADGSANQVMKTDGSGILGGLQHHQNHQMVGISIQR